MPDSIAAYVETVRAQIRWTRARSALTAEIQTHLLDQKDACLAAGMSAEAATAEALRQMGDPVFLGTELDRVHRPKPQWGLLLLAAVLVGTGLVLQLCFAQNIHERPALLRSLLAAAIGMGGMAAAYFLDFTLLGRHPICVYCGVLALAVFSLLFSRRVMGVSYYTQYVLLLVPPAYAGILYSRHGKGMRGLLSCAFALLPFAVVALLTPSVKGLLLILLTGLALLFLAICADWFGMKRKLAVLCVAVPTLFALVCAWNLQIGFSRWQIALHPELAPLGEGYQATIVRELLAGAKLFGTGAFGAYSALEPSRSLPSSGTDFILTWLIHVLGWLPVLAVLLLLAAFLTLAFWKCFHQRGLLAQLISLSIVLPLALHTLFYSINNFGFVFFGFYPLPFLAVGNLATVINLTLIGLMLSVFRAERLPADPIAHRECSESD